MSQTNGSAPRGEHSTALGARLPAAVVILMLVLGCGCSSTGTARKAGPHDPVLLQQRLMRFADDYSSRLVVAMDSLPAPTNSADAIAQLQLKLNCVSSIQTVATGPNELMNLADMFVLVTLTKAVVESQWLPSAYGQSALPMLDACRRGETNITAIALTVVSQQQLNELQGAIAKWQQEHPDLRSALFTRALGLEVEIGPRQQQTKGAPASFFSLLRLDPLAGLEPATRELAQTRLFGERAMFLAHRKPTLLRWQTEVVVLETAATPPLLEARTNATQVAAALARASTTLEQLPAFVRSEREAILNALPSQEPALTNLVAQLTAMFDAGTRMSDALNTALETTRSIEAEQLTELLRTLNETLAPTNAALLSAQVTQVVQQAQAGGRAVTDYVFYRVLLLVGFTCFAVLLTALVLLLVRQRGNRP